jgi:hypothetical protein
MEAWTMIKHAVPMPALDPKETYAIRSDKIRKHGIVRTPETTCEDDRWQTKARHHIEHWDGSSLPTMGPALEPAKFDIVPTKYTPKWPAHPVNLVSGGLVHAAHPT